MKNENNEQIEEQEATDKFWMVYVEGTRGCSRRHTEYEIAKGEAERLLKQPCNYGKKVYLLEAVEFVHFEEMPVQWKEI